MHLRVGDSNPKETKAQIGKEVRMGGGEAETAAGKRKCGILGAGDDQTQIILLKSALPDSTGLLLVVFVGTQIN